MVDIDMTNCAMTEILEDAMFPPKDPPQPRYHPLRDPPPRDPPPSDPIEDVQVCLGFLEN